MPLVFLFLIFLGFVALYFSVIFGVLLGMLTWVAGTGVTLFEFTTASWRSYRGDAPLDDLMILPRDDEPSRDPAYQGYFFGPVLRDYRRVVIEASRRSLSQLRRAFTLTNEKVFQSETLGIWRFVTSYPLAIGGLAGLAVGAATGASVLAVAGLLYGAFLLGLVGVALLLGGIFRLLELGVLTVRGITLECPQCHERVLRPIYRCDDGTGSGCRAAHQQLVPGQLGVFSRVCRCGRTLPTLLMLGKYRLVAQCSHCKAELPRYGLSAPTLHIPVAGLPQTGKSVFMIAAVQRLHESWAAEGGGKDFWADEKFTETFRQARVWLDDPDQMRKTTATRPRAYNIYLGQGLRQRRLVYLYDMAGEVYEDARDLPEHQRADYGGKLADSGFYAYTEGIVICVDPFSLAGLRRRVDRATLDQVRSLPSDPKAMLERVTENLREALKTRGSNKLKVRAAVVLTKADALGPAQIEHPYASLTAGNGAAGAGTQANGSGAAGASGDRAHRDRLVREWIAGVGIRQDLVASVLGNFESASFFVVSHVDATTRKPPAGTAPNDDPAAPVNWLLNGGSTT